MMVMMWIGDGWNGLEKCIVGHLNICIWNTSEVLNLFILAFFQAPESNYISH